MNKRTTGLVCALIALCFVMVSIPCAAETCAHGNAAADKEMAGSKAKKFGQKLFNYPANVAKQSVDVVADTGKKGTDIVVKETKTVGQVVTGDAEKAKDLVIEPIKGTAEGAADAVVDTAKIPVESAKD